MVRVVFSCNAPVFGTIQWPHCALRSTTLCTALRTGRVDSDKVVVGISTVLTWIGTTAGASGAFTEGSHKRRKPTPRYTPIKTLETHVLSLAREGVRVHIVPAGILYGGGEQDLHFLFRVRYAVWLIPFKPCLL